MNLFETYIDPGLKFIRKHAVQGMQAVSNIYLYGCCNFKVILIEG